MRLSRTLRIGAALGAATAAAIALASPAAALDASSVQSAVGVWRLSVDDGGRACTVQLRAETAGAAHAVGLPPGCRHAMPVVAKVAGWSVSAPDHIDLTDRSGAVVLAFAQAGGELSAKGPKGEAYALTAANEPRRAGRSDAQTTATTRGPVAPASELPGRYSVLREGSKDTGCMLTLHPGGKAQLAPACRDNGFVIFDPVGWSYVGGKLTLRARKGHHASFEMTPDQSWQKDQKDGGKQLGFRKM